MRNALLPGMKIICAVCGDVVCRVKNKILRGEIIRVEDFESVGTEIKNGHPMVCDKCRCPFYDSSLEDVFVIDDSEVVQ